MRTAAPLVFDLPEGATGAGVLEGSAPNAVVAGGHLTVNGPFPPGNTTVQFAYSLGFGSGTMTIRQRMPVSLMQVSLIVQKIGALQMTVSANRPAARHVGGRAELYRRSGAGGGCRRRAGDHAHGAAASSGMAAQPVAGACVNRAGGRRLGSSATAAGARPSDRTLCARGASICSETSRRWKSSDAEVESTKASTRRGTARLVTALEGVYAELDQEAAR